MKQSPFLALHTSSRQDVLRFKTTGLIQINDNQFRNRPREILAHGWLISVKRFRNTACACVCITQFEYSSAELADKSKDFSTGAYSVSGLRVRFELPDRRSVERTCLDQEASALMWKLEVDQGLNVTVSKRAMMPWPELPVGDFAIRIDFPCLGEPYRGASLRAGCSFPKANNFDYKSEF